MKILLRYGICATAVLDRDSKFIGVFHEALDLLQINCHVLSSANHNGMLVEKVNRYLNKGLKIMCTECGSMRIAEEAIFFCCMRGTLSQSQALIYLAALCHGLGICLSN